MFQLALRLNKTVSEIEQIPSAEFTEWLAYFSLEAKQEKEREAREEAAKAEAVQRTLIMGGNDGKKKSSSRDIGRH